MAGATLATQSALRKKTNSPERSVASSSAITVFSGISTFDPILHTGNGLSFEVNYGRHLWGDGLISLTAEVPLVITPTEKVHFSVGVVPKDYRSLFVTPSVRANFFASTSISPWVSFGGGFGRFKENSTLEFGDPNPGATGTTTGVLQLGIGLDVKITHAFTVRGEARDFYSGIPQLNVDIGKTRQHNIFAGGGVVWHF